MYESDSPMLGGLKAHAVRFGKATRVVKRYSPGRVSVGRRQHWSDADAACAHFAGKPEFARWTPESAARLDRPRRQPDDCRRGAVHGFALIA